MIRQRFDYQERTPVPGQTSSLPTPDDAAQSRARFTRDRAWLGDVAAVAFLVLLAVALLWPLPRHPASTLPDLGDPLDSAWRMSWPFYQLRHDPARLLDANIFYPLKTTYLFDELILGVALTVAPVIVLTGNGVLAFNVALLIAFAGNGIAMYFLARRLTGNRWAALAGALVFAAAPFRFQHVGHIGLSTAFWMPLALLCLDRAVARPTWRDAIGFGLCVAAQALSAQYYGFQIAIVAGLYLLYALVRRSDLVLHGPLIVRLVLATVLAELLLLPVVAPYVTVKGIWGYSRGLEENELFSATLSSYLAASPANFLGESIARVLRAPLGVRSWNIWLYPGLGAVLVALLGLARPRRRRAPAGDPAGGPAFDLYPFMLGLALFGVAMTLGPVLYPQAIGQGAVTRLMPYRLAFNIIPIFDAMRAPERFGNVVLLGLGGAVAFGVAAALAWVARLPARAARLALPLVAVLLLVAVGAEYARLPLRSQTVPPMPPIYGWLAARPPGVTLELPLTVPANELNREQLRQYWSTKHWQWRVNGSSDITPRVYQSLARDLDLFPDPRTLGTLQGLGVRYVIVHRAQYPPGAWDTLAARYDAYRVTLQPRGQFGDDFAYELQPDERFTALRQAVEPGADVFLSGGDPAGTDTYMAMVGYLLRDHRPITRIIPTFGIHYQRPEAGRLAAYAVVYKDEDPTRYNYPAGMPVVYEDNVVRIYRRPRS